MKSRVERDGLIENGISLLGDFWRVAAKKGEGKNKFIRSYWPPLC